MKFQFTSTTKHQILLQNWQLNFNHQLQIKKKYLKNTRLISKDEADNL